MCTGFRIFFLRANTQGPRTKQAQFRTGKKDFAARFFHVAEPLQATLFPRISFSISGQDLTKINVLVRVSSITWWRTVHETATKAEEVTYGYELCKRTSCMTSDRETRPWPRANSFQTLQMRNILTVLLYFARYGRPRQKNFAKNCNYPY